MRVKAIFGWGLALALAGGVAPAVLAAGSPATAAPNKAAAPR